MDDSILKLDSYALSVLEKNGYKNLGKRSVSRDQAKKVQGSERKVSRRQKKKLKRKMGKGCKQNDQQDVDSSVKCLEPKRKSYREKIIEELDLKTVSSCSNVIEDQSSSTKEQTNVEVVVFHDAARKRKNKKIPFLPPKEDDEEEIKISDSQEIDFKRARYEVIKFGISGFQKLEKEEARIALAVKLGAKPPKKQHVNYKVLMAERKAAKEKAKNEKELNQKMGVKLQPIPRKTKHRDKNNIAGFDGQVGKYRDGVQFVKKNDLKLNTSRKK